MTQGSILANRLGEDCAPCEQAPEVLCFLSSSFWNAAGGYLTADLNTNNVDRSGINTNQILGSIHVFDIEAPCDAKSELLRVMEGVASLLFGGADYQPCNSYSLATLKVVVDSFRDIYPVNKGIPAGRAVAVGRYLEDIYYGGNPWYLCTLAVAEFLYDAIAQFRKAGSLTIDEIDLGFFKDIYPGATIGSYSGSDLANILASMTSYADDFVSVVQVNAAPTYNAAFPLIKLAAIYSGQRISL